MKTLMKMTLKWKITSNTPNNPSEIQGEGTYAKLVFLIAVTDNTRDQIYDNTLRSLFSWYFFLGGSDW